MVFSGVRVAPYLVFCVVLCRSLFVLLSFFIWPLCCLSCDIYVQILITPLISQTLLVRTRAGENYRRARICISEGYEHFPLQNVLSCPWPSYCPHMLHLYGK